MVYTLIVIGVCDASVLVHSDNQGIIGAFGKGCSRNLMINLCIQRAITAFGGNNIHLSLSYIESALNPADPISRGDVGSEETYLASTPLLLWELSPYIACYV